MKAISRLHLNLIAKVSLVTALAASVALISVALLLDPGDREHYWEQIASLVLSESRLLPALMLSGTVVVFVAAVLTGLIAIYVSFRIAGPFYRFTRNIEAATAHGLRTPIPIRRDDVLQEEWRSLERACVTLNTHYLALHKALEAASTATSADALDQASERVVSLLSRPRI